MYRLSLKLFLVLAFVAGPVLGFAPDASAHKGTHTQAVVTGDLDWPIDPKAGLLRAGAGFDLDRAPAAGGLSLDARAVLNGCRLATGNSAALVAAGAIVPAGSGALPISTLWRLPAAELCFAFDTLEIKTVGVWEDRVHQTDFDCISSGTSSPSGGATTVPFGSFYGEFTCNGVAGTDVVPTADGHFHGISAAGGLAIAFLGEVHCTVDIVPNTCPAVTSVPTTGTYATKGSALSAGPGSPPWMNVSHIKHTLACKGNVTPGLVHKPWPAYAVDAAAVPPDAQKQAVLAAYIAAGNANDTPNAAGEGTSVNLECIIV